MQPILLNRYLLLLFLIFSWNSVKSQEENPMEPTPSIGFLKLSDGNSYFGQIESGTMSGIGTQFLAERKVSNGLFSGQPLFGGFYHDTTMAYDRFRHVV